MTDSRQIAVHNGKIYSTHDIIYLLAVLAPTRRNDKIRKRLREMLRDIERRAI